MNSFLPDLSTLQWLTKVRKKTIMFRSIKYSSGQSNQFGPFLCVRLPMCKAKTSNMVKAKADTGFHIKTETDIDSGIP